jgi:hypothetical protein
MYLQSIKSVENLTQTPFTGQFERKAEIKGTVVEMVFRLNPSHIV